MAKIATRRESIAPKVLAWLKQTERDVPFTGAEIADELKLNPTSISGTLNALHKGAPKFLRHIGRGIWYVAANTEAPDLVFNVALTVHIPPETLGWLEDQAALSKNGTTAKDVAAAILRNHAT